LGIGISVDENKNIYLIGCFSDGSADFGTIELISQGDCDVYVAKLSDNDGNKPPEKPKTPSGETLGKTGNIYPYSTNAIDLYGDNVRYGWDWNGDNTVDEWTGFNSSDTTISTTHSWTADGAYNIKVIAEDVNGAMSDWSDPLSVSMPKNKPYVNTPFLRFLENHPHLFPLLRQLLRL